jgi:hypothetical protein
VQSSSATTMTTIDRSYGSRRHGPKS